MWGLGIVCGGIIEPLKPILALGVEQRGHGQVEAEANLGARRKPPVAADTHGHRMARMFQPDQIVGTHRLLDIDDRLMHLTGDDIGIDPHMFGRTPRTTARPAASGASG